MSTPNDQIVGSSNASQSGVGRFAPGQVVRDVSAFASLYARPAGRSDEEYSTELAARGLCVLCSRAEWITGQFRGLQLEATRRGVPILVPPDAADVGAASALPPWATAGDAEKEAAIAAAKTAVRKGRK